ncbi:MAG TPA: hypothetical protein VEK09_07130 [Jatrophihabitantaceae bacterium]|nr:hypothetical protein [Jatrophihabitantaceae bacterium]
MSPARRELTVGEIRDLMTELGRRLQSKGVEGTLYLVDGAAIALSFDQRRVTVDVDAAFEPEEPVVGVAREIAEEKGLSANWLNNSARAFMPGGDTEAVPLAVPGLTVAVASPEHLLAMKMAAFRPADMADLELLFRELGIGKPEEAADIALKVYGEDTVVLPGRDDLVLSARAILERLRRGGH